MQNESEGAVMYTSFTIENFRCFKHLELKDLARVNLITGRNNTGKTSVLEALLLFSGDYVRISQILRLPSAFKNESDANTANMYFRSFFKNLDSALLVRIIGETTSGKTNKLEIESIGELPQSIGDPGILPIPIPEFRYYRLSEPEPYYKHSIDFNSNFSVPNDPKARQCFPAMLLSCGRDQTKDAQRLSVLEPKNREVLLEALKVIEPRLNMLKLHPVGGSIVIHVDLGLHELLPVTLLGEGFQHILSLVLAISSTKNGILLIDEIENGLHYSTLPDVWRVVSKAAEDFNVQIFATTHSAEMIEAAHETFKENELYDFKLIRLQRNKDGELVAKELDEELLEAAMDVRFEIR